MDPSKFPQGSDECSNNESGWTTYIGSPHHEEDRDDDDDDRDRSKDGEEHKEKDADSDDSMASDASSAPSDASSAPSDQFGHFNKQLGYGYAKSTSERKHGGKKEQKQGDTKQHAEKIKAAKDKADCATGSRKK